MHAQPPILEGQPLNDEQKRISALFDEMKKNQLIFLDEAGKRIIELTTGLLGLLFAVTAFGKDFPPPYLSANPARQGLAVAALAAFALALLFGVLTVQPRHYDNYETNLTRMRKELDRIVTYKSRCMAVATWAFFVAALLLAVLVGALVLGA
jgi:hypothetical protein